MIKELVKMANRLDSMGLKVEADRIDGIIRRIASREEANGMMSDDKHVDPDDKHLDPFDDESEDPGDWSHSKWKEWNSQAGTFGKNEYTVVKLYKGDGETPVFEAKHEMVGGTQEDPELEWVKKEIIIPVKGGIGDRFDIKEGLSSMTKIYEIVELGTEGSPGKAVRVK